MITKDEKSKLRSTIALLSSMINGGEQHSEQSKKEVSEALGIVNNLAIHDVSKQSELLIAFTKEIMSNKEYHELENIDIVEKYTKSNL